MKANTVLDVFKHIDMQGGDKEKCWPWKLQLSPKGRPYHTVRGKKHLAYRLTYELVHGTTIDSDVVVRHKCDNSACCNPHHLELGSHQENMDDMKERERHGLPHITVRAIRKAASNGTTHEAIAALFGLGRSTVTEIVNGTNYAHVKDEDE